MADTSFSTITARIQGEIPDCPDFFIESRFKEVAMTFFKDTLSWRVDLDPTALIKKTSTYEIEVPSKSAVAEILSIVNVDKELIPSTEAQLLVKDAEWRSTTGDPTHYVQLSPDTFTVYPQPAATIKQALQIRVAIYPTLDATKIDSVIFNDNYHALIYGTLAAILMMIGKAWSDPSQGGTYAQLYSQEARVALDKNNNGRVRAKRVVRYGGI
jgi:hypothetical protein